MTEAVQGEGEPAMEAPGPHPNDPNANGPTPVRVVTLEIINLGEALRSVGKFVPNDSPLDRTEVSVTARDDGSVNVDVLSEA